MKITLGSMSTHKLNAVRQACQELGLDAVVLGVKTQSGQNEQPVGFDETFGGALNRATSAMSQNPDSIAIGIESGIFHFGVTLDIAVIVVLTPDDRRIVTTSEGIEFPEEFVRIAEERGFETTTVGSVITERLGGDPTDPHSVLTKGKVTRTKTLVDALKTALHQL
jgi:non-canonical (house-cleaning) NTP pyrophosphatase